MRHWGFHLASAQKLTVALRAWSLPTNTPKEMGGTQEAQSF